MTETARLTTSANLYGLASLAISGNTVVAGYPLASATGAAAVFVEPAGGWRDTNQRAILTASDGASADELGASVAIDEETVIAGSPYAEGSGSSGAVYVFAKPANGWDNATQTAKLTAAYGLGLSIGISHETIAAVADSGVDLFAEPPGGWTNLSAPLATLEPPLNVLGFYPTAIEGKVILAGSNEWPEYYSAYGAAFAYVEPAGGWQTTSSPSGSFYGNPSEGQQEIGYSVAVSGSTLVTGAPYSNNATGVVYLFAPK